MREVVATAWTSGASRDTATCCGTSTNASPRGRVSGTPARRDPAVIPSAYGAGIELVQGVRDLGGARPSPGAPSRGWAGEGQLVSFPADAKPRVICEPRANGADLVAFAPDFKVE